MDCLKIFGFLSGARQLSDFSVLALCEVTRYLRRTVSSSTRSIEVLYSMTPFGLLVGRRNIAAFPGARRALVGDLGIGLSRVQRRAVQ
jgi:hypothetical protein